jgi:hypothetical protein
VQTYSINQTEKETKREEVSIKILPRTSVVVLVKWKKIWQNGIVNVIRNENNIWIPYRVFREVTFDLEQKAKI